MITERPIYLIGSGRDQVTIFSRRSGPCYLQRVSGGQITGITFRYVGSDQHSALNILDSTCTIAHCRATEGLLSGVVIYGPGCRPTLLENEICYNRESGLFVFAGAQPYLRENQCFANHHFGIAARDQGTRPDIIKNICQDNMLSGLLLFSKAQALILDNTFEQNAHWGAVLTPDSEPTPRVEGTTPVQHVHRQPSWRIHHHLRTPGRHWPIKHGSSTFLCFLCSQAKTYDMVWSLRERNQGYSG